MNSKSVLYLSYDGMTDPLGQSQVLPYLKGLSQHGYTFHLVSFEKPDRYLKHRKHIQSICDNSGILWHPQDYAVGGSIFNTIKQVRRMRRIAFYLDTKYNFGVVHCRSYIAALAGLKLKRKTGLSFVFDMRGFWADERVDGKLWSLSNPLYKWIYKYFKRKEIQFFKESDYTISLTHNGKKEIESWPVFKGELPKIEVIPCCVDLDLFNISSIDQNRVDQLKKKLGIASENFVLGYVGSIGTWYMLKEMLDYFSVLKKSKPQAKFLFLTSETSSLIIEAAQKVNISTEDLIIQSVLHVDVPLYMSLFDKSIFFIRSTYSKKASSPTKQGEIMAMGIPLVCNSGVGDTDIIVKNYDAGIVLEEFSPDAYHEEIISEKLYETDKIINGARDYFSLEKGVNSYLSVYKQLNE